MYKLDCLGPVHLNYTRCNIQQGRVAIECKNWKLWGYPKIYLGHSDDFEFGIQNNECITIVGKSVGGNFQGISFNIFLMESCIWDIELDTPTPNYPLKPSQI